MEKYTDFFDLIDNGGNQPIAALFMTYGFDAGLFEQHILPAFLGVVDDPNENELRFRNQIALKLKEVPVAVISDAKQFNGGRTFIYDSIVVDTETFHPKCYMLLFKEYLRVIISSGNITKSGLCYNAELVWYEDLYLDKTNSISKELCDILTFMDGRYGLDKIVAVQEIRKYLEKCRAINDFPKVLSTCVSQTVLSRIQEELEAGKGKCKSITVMSPFFENDREWAIESTLLMSFFDELKAIYPNIKIKICFPANYKKQEDKYEVNAPVGIFKELTKKYKDIGLFVVQREWERENEDSVPRTLHAKLIYAEFDNKYNLYLSGSVNFTNNAMKSSVDNLRNIEIGILNYTKSKLLIPNCTKVTVDKLIIVEKIEAPKQPACFVDSAVYNGRDLCIKFNFKKIVVPCEIHYNGHVLATISEVIDEKEIRNFSLKKPQDLRIVCEDFTFFVPILIPNKDDIVTDDLKLTFELGMKDIIDYLAGKYKSMSELERKKRLGPTGGEDKQSAVMIFFRQNLQRFFKALASLKQGLELPYYTETSFHNYITAPIGIKNLIVMILEDYKQGVTGEVETFLFLVEMWNVLEHLEYQEDWLAKEFKKQVLGDLMKESRAVLIQIIKGARGNVKSQYQIMLKGYGLEV